jgi:hypothetical protein
MKKVLKELEKRPKWKRRTIKCGYNWSNKCAVRIIASCQHASQLFQSEVMHFMVCYISAVSGMDGDQWSVRKYGK